MAGELDRQRMTGGAMVRVLHCTHVLARLVEDMASRTFQSPGFTPRSGDALAWEVADMAKVQLADIQPASEGWVPCGKSEDVGKGHMLAIRVTLEVRVAAKTIRVRDASQHGSTPVLAVTGSTTGARASVP
jgi:hypothetical protein